MKELTSFKMVNFIVFSQCMFCSPSWRCLYHVERQINNHSLIPSTQPRPQGFSLKKWVAHPFFKGKALGMRLTVNWRDTNHFDSEDDYRTGCRNVSHCQQQQSYSGLRSPGRSNSTYFWIIDTSRYLEKSTCCSRSWNLVHFSHICFSQLICCNHQSTLIDSLQMWHYEGCLCHI